jgi:hypothetical protein
MRVHMPREIGLQDGQPNIQSPVPSPDDGYLWTAVGMVRAAESRTGGEKM